MFSFALSALGYLGLIAVKPLASGIAILLFVLLSYSYSVVYLFLPPIGIGGACAWEVPLPPIGVAGGCGSIADSFRCWQGWAFSEHSSRCIWAQSLDIFSSPCKWVTVPCGGSAMTPLITLTGIGRAEAESQVVGQLLKATSLHPPHHCCSLLAWPGPTTSSPRVLCIFKSVQIFLAWYFQTLLQAKIGTHFQKLFQRYVGMYVSQLLTCLKQILLWCCGWFSLWDGWQLGYTATMTESTVLFIWLSLSYKPALLLSCGLSYIFMMFFINIIAIGYLIILLHSWDCQYILPWIRRQS